VDQGASEELDQYKSIQGDTDAMMRVGQATFRAYCKPAENKDDSDQGHSQDVEVDVKTQCEAWVAIVETSAKDG
jgi:hypothetical protein